LVIGENRLLQHNRAESRQYFRSSSGLHTPLGIGILYAPTVATSQPWVSAD